MGQRDLLLARAVHRLDVEKPGWKDNVWLQPGAPHQSFRSTGCGARLSPGETVCDRI